MFSSILNSFLNERTFTAEKDVQQLIQSGIFQLSLECFNQLTAVYCILWQFLLIS